MPRVARPIFAHIPHLITHRGHEVNLYGLNAFLVYGIGSPKPIGYCGVSGSRKLFRMRHDVNNVVGTDFDGDVKTPAAGDPCLPDSSSLIVLLGSERWVRRLVTKRATCLPKALWIGAGALS